MPRSVEESSVIVSDGIWRGWGILRGDLADTNNSHSKTGGCWRIINVQFGAFSQVVHRSPLWPGGEILGLDFPIFDTTFSDSAQGSRFTSSFVSVSIAATAGKNPSFWPKTAAEGLSITSTNIKY